MPLIFSVDLTLMSILRVCDAFRPKHARRDMGGTKTP